MLHGSLPIQFLIWPHDEHIWAGDDRTHTAVPMGSPQSPEPPPLISYIRPLSDASYSLSGASDLLQVLCSPLPVGLNSQAP